MTLNGIWLIALATLVIVSLASPEILKVLTIVATCVGALAAIKYLVENTPSGDDSA